MKEAASLLEGKNWFLRNCYSKNPWGVLRFSGPLSIAYFAYALYLNPELSFLSISGLILLGAFFWSFSEYMIHRFAFHLKFHKPLILKSDFLRAWHHRIHLNHHDEPNDLTILNAGPIFGIPMSFLVGFFPLYLMTRDSAITCFMMVGYIYGHWLYEWLHYAAHSRHSTSGLLGWLKKYHMRHHHIDSGAYFGVTSPLWDFIFRTHQPKVNQAVGR